MCSGIRCNKASRRQDDDDDVDEEACVSRTAAGFTGEEAGSLQSIKPSFRGDGNCEVDHCALEGRDGGVSKKCDGGRGEVGEVGNGSN